METQVIGIPCLSQSVSNIHRLLDLQGSIWSHWHHEVVATHMLVAGVAVGSRLVEALIRYRQPR